MSRRARERQKQDEIEQSWKEQRDDELEQPEHPQYPQYPEDESDQGYKPETFR